MKRICGFKHLIRFNILLSVISILPTAMYENKIHKLYFHKGLSGDKIVLYFSKKPKIERKEDNVFFIPCHCEGDEIVQMVRALRRIVRPWYIVTCSLSKEPLGVELAFHQRDLQNSSPKLFYAFFDTIGQQKGIVFNILKNEIKEDIKKSSEKLGPVVIVDYGHGGTDNGALGLYKIKEKDITRIVGQKLVKLLRSRGINVMVTRSDDQTVALDERTMKANYTPRAVLFVSLHANSSPNKSASGIETFCAHKELFNIPKEIFTKKLNDFSLCHVASCLCADFVHQHIMRTIYSYSKLIKDRGVKRSVSQILIGTDIPSILIELGFVTNKSEAFLLKQPFYQQLLAQGSYNGILAYLKHQKIIL